MARCLLLRVLHQEVEHQFLLIFIQACAWEHALRDAQPLLLIEATRIARAVADGATLVEDFLARCERGRGLGAQGLSALQTEEGFVKTQVFLGHGLRRLKRFGAARIGIGALAQRG